MKTTLKNANLTAVIKHLSAELISLKSNTNKEYIWEGNPEFWGKHSPVLFPIVGTLKNNTFHHNKTDYYLSRHGFAREMDFKLVKTTDTSATFAIQSDEKTLKMYPFEFELYLIYTLDEMSISIAYQVNNSGLSKMPFSIGAHPAFAIPNKFENYAIAFEKEELLEYYLLENDLISNKTKKLEVQNKQIPLNYELFENDALVFKNSQVSEISLLLGNLILLVSSFNNPLFNF